jgi:HxlR-like helix-turn-helix protein
VEVIGDRWSPLVLRDVMFGSRRHFRVLQERSAEGIASNILAERLRRLVADGLLTGHKPAAPNGPNIASPGRGPARPRHSRTRQAAHATTPPCHRCERGPDLWDDFTGEHVPRARNRRDPRERRPSSRHLTVGGASYLRQGEVEEW